MSNYTKVVDFAAKDDLPEDSASRIVKGSEFETEFDAIAVAVNSKADANAAALTGSSTAVNLDVTGTFELNGTALTVTAVELNTLDGITASLAEINTLDGLTATTAELNIMDGVTATTAEINKLDGVTATTAELNKTDGLTPTTTELNYVDGVTGPIQTQLNAKAPINNANFTGNFDTPGIEDRATSQVMSIASNGIIQVTSNFELFAEAGTTFAVLDDSSTIAFAANTNGEISMRNLPTSDALLLTGDLWNDNGTVKIKL